jgi:hypothetical protein
MKRFFTHGKDFIAAAGQGLHLKLELSKYSASVRLDQILGTQNLFESLESLLRQKIAADDQI